MDFNDYLNDLREGWQALDLAQVEAVRARLDEARHLGGTVFIAGNGGSAATASHFAADLNKLASSGHTPSFRAIALADSVPQLTAWANDEAFDKAFQLVLRGLARAGDVLVAITTSGSSPNLTWAMLEAHSLQMTNILIVGRAGAFSRSYADLEVVAAAPRQTQQEDLAMIICHMLAEALRDGSD